MSDKIKPLLNKLKKKFGEDILAEGHKDLPKISTGSIGLNRELNGGFPMGRIVEIFGWESSGKTTLSLLCIKDFQKNHPEKLICFVDVEHAFDQTYAEQLGVDMDKVLLVKPDYGEQALEVVEELVETGEVGLIVVDSIAALVPKSETEGDMGDASMGKHARLMSQACRKLTPKVSKTDCVVIMLNQIREKIGVMYGNPETTTGGNAMRFYASVRVKLHKSMQIKDGTNVVGHTVKATVVKSKVSMPFGKVEFDITHGKGINKMKELISVGIDTGVLEMRGSWCYFGEDRLAQGKEKLAATLEDNPELWDKVRQAVERESSSD